MPNYTKTNKKERLPERHDDDDSYDEDEDDMSVDFSCNDEEESSIESLDEEDASLSELETTQMKKKSDAESKQKNFSANEKTKKKNPFINPEVKIKKSRFEFPYEAMDVSDEEKENQRGRSDKWGKQKININLLKKKIYEIMKVNKKKNRRRTKKKSGKVKTDKKTGKMKGKKFSPKKKSRNTMKRDKPVGVHNSTKLKSRQDIEQNSNKENNYTDDHNKNNDKISAAGETLTQGKTIANEKKTSKTINKNPDPAEIKVKGTKEDKEKEVTNDTKAREKVEDLRKKVDGKKAKNMDETITSTVIRNPQPSGTQKLKLHVTKMLRMASGETKKRSRHL